MGPLAGVRVIELAGLGAAPYAGMMLADMGAEVTRVERMPPPPALPDVLARSRRSVCLDLKQPAGVAALMRLVDDADVLFEGFRPGVAERLGVGPDDCASRNPKLVYGRMTGWGQTGPLAGAAGHDLNYVALSGALHAIGPQGGKPVPPLNLVGDFGGGLLLAFGIVCALNERERTGTGQVVDAAMLDAATSFMGMFAGFNAMGAFEEGPGESMLAGAAPFYDTYETADGKFIALGSLEPQFYSLLVEKLELDPERFGPYGFRGPASAKTRAAWVELKVELAARIRERTRDEWCELLEGSDVCFAPVLSLSEAPSHPHNEARDTFVDVAGIPQNAPAPRFSRTTPAMPEAARPPGADTHEVLAEAGFSGDEITGLAEGGVIPDIN